MPLSEEKEKELEKTANSIRATIIETLERAGSGHSAGPLGMADIFTAFYFHILNHRPNQPDWEDRDRLILSNGHITPVRYVAMAYAGYFPLEELKTLRQINSRLQGHPHRGSLPGLETTSGPLGSGLSQACGVALAARLDDKKHRIYCFMSDGEQDSGNTWEARGNNISWEGVASGTAVGSDVRVIGIMENENAFRVTEIRPWKVKTAW